LVNGVNDIVLSKISASRDIEPDELRNISNNMLVTGPSTALEYGLIDGIIYYDEVEAKMKELVGIGQDDDLELIRYSKYEKAVGSEGSGSDRIAVIVASGEIYMGDGDQSTIGADKFRKEFKKARESGRVKAVVLRINSPGGSIIASDVLWREIQETRKVKPVIASMSDLAASGGYYLAMGCDTIVAQPNTITGSIGIFGILMNMQELFNDKLGITFDVAKTGEYSDLFTITRPLTDVEKQKIQVETQAGYDTFIAKAAEGRGMSEESIEEVASGRVWRGEKAKELGLVDVIGDFEDAVMIAAEKAGSEEYKLRFYPEQKTFLEEFLFNLEQNARVRSVRAELGELYPYYETLKSATGMTGIQARMPYDIKLY
jgi:protease-4